jgi:hypothetical protein
VDFILKNGRVALEAKGITRVDSGDLRGLASFLKDNKPEQAIVVSNEKRARVTGGMEILPWKVFVERLWEGKVI